METRLIARKTFTNCNSCSASLLNLPGSGSSDADGSGSIFPYIESFQKKKQTKPPQQKKIPNPPPGLQVPWFQLKSPVNLKRSLFKKGLKDFHLIDSM